MDGAAGGAHGVNVVFNSCNTYKNRAQNVSLLIGVNPNAPLECSLFTFINHYLQGGGYYVTYNSTGSFTGRTLFDNCHIYENEAKVSFFNTMDPNYLTCSLFFSHSLCSSFVCSQVVSCLFATLGPIQCLVRVLTLLLVFAGWRLPIKTWQFEVHLM